jgi:GTP-binding protein
VAKIFDLAVEIDQRRHTVIKTRVLNRWLEDVVASHPPAGLKNRNPKLNYIVQETDNPNPSFKVFGAHTKFLHWSYKRYMERNMRENWDYIGTPIKFWYIEKHETHKHGQRRAE